MRSRQSGHAIRFIVLVFAFAIITLISQQFSPAFAEDPIPLDQRVLRTEERLEAQQQQNEQLQREILELRQRLEEEVEVESMPPLTTPVLPPVPPLAKVEVAPPFDVGYKNGFFLSSEDGDFSLLLGGRVTGRYTAFASDTPLDDQFSIKRGRLETDATLLEYYTLRLQIEFADASRPTDSYSTKLKDGYIDIHYFPEARLRAGQFKVPFSFEALQSHKYLDFADLSLAVNNMRASRDIGVMLHGITQDKFLQYQLALLNGSGENRPDNNSSKDIAARVALLPFTHTDIELLSPLLLGLSGTFGDQDTDLSSTSFRTISGTEFVTFDDSSLTGDRERVGTEFIWPIGPASLKSEVMWMWWNDVENGSAKEDASFFGWYVSGSCFLTGEKKTLARVVPLKPFDPHNKTWGAWEVAARYSAFEADDDLFDAGLASGTDRAQAFTVGLNWYLNPFMRMIFDYEHTEFDDSFEFESSGDTETIDEEDVFLVQWQLEF